ncbi:MAG: ribosome biogenesis/translation initiation ATPase RLI, partial [Thermoplasmataceae archaeon]
KTIDCPGPDTQPIITESLCIGCGICPKRCPFGAIKIIGIPDELNRDIIHQYGLNTFRLYSMPIPEKNAVTAILGSNGMGKTTTMNILSGVIIPNFGDYESKPDKDKVIERYSKSILGQYFRDIYSGKRKTVLKSQFVDQIPRVAKGTIKEILEKNNISGKLDEVVEDLNLKNSLSKDVKSASGGELQKLAIGTALLKDADIILIDEMTSYLDISERLNIAKKLQEMAKKKTLFVVEHDLAILDWIADSIHLVYGQTGAYGVTVKQKSSGKAINEFLAGYLPDENVRIRPYAIEFDEKGFVRTQVTPDLVNWNNFSLTLGDFTLESMAGKIESSYVVVVLGVNELGKTTFVKVLAGVIEAKDAVIEPKLKIAYKPQYISTDFSGTVSELIYATVKERFDDSFLKVELFKPLEIDSLMEQNVSSLSGGELQRLSIAITLATDADLYLMDEPSANLDSTFRMICAKVIRKIMESNRKSALIVDHDVYFIDLISDSLVVFGGEPGKHGYTIGPMRMDEGMNTFLKMANITFRRDHNTKRPRINKLNSSLDREQKYSGNYYYKG